MARKSMASIFVVILAISVFCVPMSQAHPYAWTFMVYSCAECDLEGFQLGYFNQMASVGSTSDVNIAVQMDRINGYSSSYDDWTDCKRFYVTKGLTPTNENAICSLGEVNMGDQNTLLDFLTWAIQEYPASHYFAMIIGHGWIDGVCFDWTNNDMLTPLELQWALSQAENITGVKVDVIGFEACQWSSLEVAYEIGDYADLIIATEEVSTHWPYQQILSNLTASPTRNPSSIASMIVDYYSQYSVTWGGEIMTLSAFNMSKITEVATATTNLANKLIANITRFAHAILDATSRTESHEPIWSEEEAASCRDLYDFAVEIKQEIPDTSTQLAAQNLINAIENACIAEWHGSGHPHFHGLYIYLPNNKEVYDARRSIYGRTYFIAHPLWTQDTTWDDLLYMLYNTYAEGLQSREQIVQSSCTPFDSDNDDFLDAVHLKLNCSTNGEPINITAHGYLIDPNGNIVDHYNDTWTIDNAGSKGDIYLYMPSGGEEGWYDVKLSVYDEFGILESEQYKSHIAYLPEPMVHDVAVTDAVNAKTIVAKGFQGKINVKLENQGHYSETFNVTIYANGTAINVTQIQLDSHDSIAFSVYLDTTGWLLGNYTISIHVEPVLKETDVSDNTLSADQELCITISGDVDGDFDVDLYDAVKLLVCYGTKENALEYNSICDINGDGNIDLYDAVTLLTHYGQKYP
jgi:hypothetical protein